jgi:FrmR/RcnR family transcriptional regulator, repressor of frmRAB operon
MAHTVRDKKKLLNRVRRVRGQVQSVERLLEEESECFDILQQIAACRGAINALMAEVLEGHIRCHVIDPGQPARRGESQAIEELIAITRSYLR